MNRKVLLSTALFLAFELGVVDQGGAWLAHRAGFDPSALTAVTILVCIGGGYMAARFGGYGSVAGALITGIDAELWVLTGGMTEHAMPPAIQPIAGVIVVVVGLVGGGLLGAFGGWLARRRRAATDASTR